MCKVCVQIHFLHVKIRFFQLHLLTEFLSPLNYLCFFAKNQLTTFVGCHFLVLCSILVTYVPIFISPVLHCLDYCSFISKVNLPSLFLLISIVLVILCLLLFPYKLQNQIVSIYRVDFWDFNWNFIESTDKLERNDILMIVTLPIHEHKRSLFGILDLL